MSKDHGFTGNQQAEYDSLNWRGRDFYDDARWNEGADHDTAFRDARHSYGLKDNSALLRSYEADLRRVWPDKPESWFKERVAAYAKTI